MSSFVQNIIDILRNKRGQIAKAIEHQKKNVHDLQRLDTKRSINVVFVCNRPNLWCYADSIFKACNDDENFNVTIVAAPIKNTKPGLGFNHNKFDTTNAEVFFKNYPCRVVNGYNYETEEWLDLRTLNPDYVFFQTPYNATRPDIYSSKIVSKYAKICYTHYGFSMLTPSVIEDFASDFFQYAYFIFAETEFHRNDYISSIQKHNKLFNTKNIVLTGATTFDDMSNTQKIESGKWKNCNKSMFKIARSARWTDEEGMCTFKEYNNVLFNYCETRNCNFIFRPHHQAFSQYILEGILSKDELDKIINIYTQSKNCTINTDGNYMDTLLSSDVLISDPSGIMFQYIYTGKPMIYTKKSTDWLNEFAKEVIVEGSYIVQTEGELIETLDMLRAGEDPLYEKRQQIIKDNFYINPNGVGHTIKEIIKKDFYGK